MKILFLGDVVGNSGYSKVIKSLLSEVKKKRNRFCNIEWGKCSRTWSWFD